MTTSPAIDPVDQALSQRHWETARRLCLKDLAQPDVDPDRANRRLHQLHDAYRRLGDIPSATSALERITPRTPEETCDLALTRARDFGHIAQFSFYRNSAEARAGLTYELYLDKMRDQAKTQIEYVIRDGGTPEQKEFARTLLDAIYQTHEGLSLDGALAKISAHDAEPVPQAEEGGGVYGTVRFSDGQPAANITVTLGLKFISPFPNPETHLERDMGGPAELPPLRGLTAVTDDEGRFRFESVPAERHEFLAVTLDPVTYDIPTRFLQHGVTVKANETTVADLTITDWKSAPPRAVPSPFAERIQHDGRNYRRVHELTLKNPFYFNFPRQAVSFALPPGVSLNDAALLLLSSGEEKKPQPFQIGLDGLTFFTSLPQQSDRVFALYQVQGSVPASTPQANLTLAPDADGKSAVIDTGAASFRIAYGIGTDVVAPLLAVKGKDGLWRGEGRFRLPENLSILSRQTTLIESGPLVLSVRIDYALSNEATYSWILTAHRDEAYLLVREISPQIAGAAFDFSLREFHGGRGYLHWCAEGDSQHWTHLTSEKRELARIQESVAWWLPPQGFGYGMAPKELDRKDFIGVFSRRRGEWIDRRFAEVTQGPGENRELDWPFPEMVGSTISMITAHTDTTGDAYFHFGFFDGERQWGILVSDVELNDGPFKEISAVQHKNSSPRLQDYKDWHLDEQDKIERPCVLAHRADLKQIRAKKHRLRLAPHGRKCSAGKSAAARPPASFSPSITIPSPRGARKSSSCTPRKSVRRCACSGAISAIAIPPSARDPSPRGPRATT